MPHSEGSHTDFLNVRAWPAEGADELDEAGPLLAVSGESARCALRGALSLKAHTSSCECTARKASSAISLARSFGQPASTQRHG